MNRLFPRLHGILDDIDRLNERLAVEGENLQRELPGNHAEHIELQQAVRHVGTAVRRVHVPVHAVRVLLLNQQAALLLLDLRMAPAPHVGAGIRRAEQQQLGGRRRKSSREKDGGQDDRDFLVHGFPSSVAFSDSASFSAAVRAPASSLLSHQPIAKRRPSLNRNA